MALVGLILHALDAGAERILIGCGDSGTNDEEAMVQALGAKLLDQDGQQIRKGAIGLLDLCFYRHIRDELAFTTC